MYSLSIFFGPSPVPAQLLFKDKEKANSAYELASGVPHAIDSVGATDKFFCADDFGQNATVKFADIHAIILEDMDLGEESRIQRGLSQARGQANANKRAQSDPILQAANRAQGPSVLTPFGNGGFGRN